MVFVRADPACAVGRGGHGYFDLVGCRLLVLHALIMLQVVVHGVDFLARVLV